MERKYAEELVRNPSETLTIEMKRWLSLAEIEHQAKIVMALLALRNRDGGFLLIGFDDKTGDALPISIDVRSEYKIDSLQGLVSKYSSEPFGIEIEYVERNSVLYPVIAVPGGVRTPAAIKSNLQKPHGKYLLRAGDIPFRTLRANNTFSSAAAQPGDWPDIMDICFNNREADIARFVRRHLSTADLPLLLSSMGLIKEPSQDSTLKEAARDFMAHCEERYRTAATGHSSEPGSGVWEVAAVMHPAVQGTVADRAFIDRLFAVHPRYSGQVWMDSRAFQDQGSHPIQRDGGWEALIRSSSFWEIEDFMRFEPEGRFYLRRLLDDDASARARGAKAGVLFDPDMAAQRTAEAIAVALRFVAALVEDTSVITVGFLFRYHGLKGRNLGSWTGTRAIFPFAWQATNDGSESFIAVPGDTPPSSVAPFAHKAILKLLAAFGGFSISPQDVEKRVAAFLASR